MRLARVAASRALRAGGRYWAAQAKAAAVQCGGSVEGFRDVIGTYLATKQQNELARLRRGAPPRRAEWRYSRPDTRTYNHLMHKLETLSRSVVSTNPGDIRCQESTNDPY